jgi:glycosyltransferase involved in cell wall biosynthesis
MVGNFTQRRHHLVLLEALSLVEKTHKPYLILIGSGQEESILRKFCGEYKLDNVRFLNNVQFEDLAAYYAAADAYVHTGIEPYSNAVIYGAIAGLPIISTTRIGGAQEISWESMSPFLVEPNDIPMISNYMAWLTAHPEEAAALGADLQKIALTRNPVWAAEQFEKAVWTALRSMIQ